MNPLVDFTTISAFKFAIIMVRVTGIFVASPFLTSRNIPNQMKLAFSLVVTLILLPLVKFPVGVTPPGNLFGFFYAIVPELAIGLVVGFIFTLMFAAVQLAGHLIDVMIGFGLANIVDPVSNIQISVLGQFYYLIAMLVFLAIGGHHLIIKALNTSFEVLPPLTPLLTNGVVNLVNSCMADVFMVAFQIGAPTLAALFVADVILGVMARTVPQMNVLMVGFPLKIFIGMITMVISIPYFVRFMYVLLEGINRDALSVLRVMRAV